MSGETNNPYFCIVDETTCQQHEKRFFKNRSVFDLFIGDALINITTVCNISDTHLSAYDFKKMMCFWSMDLVNKRNSDMIPNDACDPSSDEGLIILDDLPTQNSKKGAEDCYRKSLNDGYQNSNQKSSLKVMRLSNFGVFIDFDELETMFKDNSISVLVYLDENFDLRENETKINVSVSEGHDIGCLPFLSEEGDENVKDDKDNETEEKCFGLCNPVGAWLERTLYDMRHITYKYWRISRLKRITVMYSQSLSQDVIQLVRLEHKHTEALKKYEKKLGALCHQRKTIIERFISLWYFNPFQLKLEDIVASFQSVSRSEQHMKYMVEKSITMLESIRFLKTESTTMDTEIKTQLQKSAIDCEWLESSLRSYIVFLANIILLVEWDMSKNTSTFCESHHTTSKRSELSHISWINERCKDFGDMITSSMDKVEDLDERNTFAANVRFMFAYIDETRENHQPRKNSSPKQQRITNALEKQFISKK